MQRATRNALGEFCVCRSLSIAHMNDDKRQNTWDLGSASQRPQIHIRFVVCRLSLENTF